MTTISSSVSPFPSPSPSLKKPTIPFTVFSGAVMAAIELLTLGHILDRIKTHQQAHPRTSGYKAMRTIYNLKGIPGFYTGIRWNLITHCGKAGFRWLAMKELDEFCYYALPKDLVKKYPALQKTALAISVSVIESSLLVCPAESFKTKEMTQANATSFKVFQWIKHHGFKTMYEGWDAVLFRQAISWSSFLVSYDIVNRSTLEYTGQLKLNLIQQFFVGAMAGAINVACTTPIDTVKTQMQKINPLHKSTIFSAIPDFYRQNGLKAFYSGFAVRLLRSTWYAGITLTMMEKLGIFRSHHA